MNMRHLTNPFDVIASTNDNTDIEHVLRNSKGLTAAIEVTPDTVYYSFANCCPTDQFNRKIGYAIAAERLANRVAVPNEIVSMLFAKNYEHIDYTILNPQIILDIVIPFVIEKHI